jgi:hypothetical protein
MAATLILSDYPKHLVPEQKNKEYHAWKSNKNLTMNQGLQRDTVGPKKNNQEHIIQETEALKWY